MKKRIRRWITGFLAIALISANTYSPAFAAEAGNEDSLALTSTPENELDSFLPPWHQHDKVKTEFPESQWDGSSISATADESANLPQNTELTAETLSKTDAACDDAFNKVIQQTWSNERRFVALTCLDVSLVSEGTKIEPENGNVYITMHFSEPLFADVIESGVNYHYNIYHIIEETGVVEDVKTAVHTENGAVTGIEFCLNSFSRVVVSLESDLVSSADLAYNDYGIGTKDNGNGDRANAFGYNYDGYYTNFFRVKGSQGYWYDAYCIEALASTPGSDYDLSESQLVNLSADQKKELRKILYYGYGGPGNTSTDNTSVDLGREFFTKATIDAYFDSAKQREMILRNTTDRIGMYATAENYNLLLDILDLQSAEENQDDDDQLRKNFYYIMTHMAASYAYYKNPLNDENKRDNPFVAACWGCNGMGLGLVDAWYNYLISQPEPAGLSFQEDDANCRVTLNGSPRTSKVEITVPEGFCITFEGTTYIEGQIFAMYPGDSFTYSVVKKLADSSSVTQFTSTSYQGDRLECWNAVIIKVSGKQNVGAWAYSPDVVQSADTFTLNWSKANFSLVKTDEKNNIIKQAGVTFDIYADAACSTKLGEITTDANGAASAWAEYSGSDNKVYLKETKAPEGYELSSEVKEVLLDSTGTTSVSYKNTELKGNVELQKVSDALLGITGTPGNIEFVYGISSTGLENAVFEIYAKEPIKAAYDPSVILYEKDTLVATISTDADGRCSAELPFGSYYLKEKTAPAGYQLNKRIYNFTLTEDNPAANLGSVVNIHVPINVSLIKKDGDAPLSGAVFGLYAGEQITASNGDVLEPDTLIEQIVSDANGIAAFDSNLPPAKYYVKELLAPSGYTRNPAVIQVDLEADETGSICEPTISFTNDRVLGSLELTKKGEVLTGVTTKDGQHTFLYEMTGLAGAEFGLYARDPIVAPYDAQQVLYEKDALVASLVTDADGNAKLNNLYLGNYYLKELKAPRGFKLDDKEYEVPLVYQGQDVPVVKVELTKANTIYNTRQKIDLSIVKVASHKWYEGLDGAKFALYAAENITSGSKVILKKDTLIGTAVSGEKGQVRFAQDLPLGKYYVKELTAPEGYERTDQVLTIDASSVSADTEWLVLSYTVENHKEDPVTTPDPADTQKTSGAQTGDSSNPTIWLCLLAASLSVIVAAAFLRRRRQTH